MAKGEKQIKHTEQQKAEIVEQICLLYESQNATIASCCKACGISDRTFLLWLAEDSELSERYKKAKENQDTNYWQEIIKPLAKTAMQRHLEVEYAEDESDVIYQGVLSKDADGNPLKQRSRKAVLPNPTALIFAMKGVYPGMFAERHEHTGKDGGPIETKTLIIELPADGGDE